MVKLSFAIGDDGDKKGSGDKRKRWDGDDDEDDNVMISMSNEGEEVMVVLNSPVNLQETDQQKREVHSTEEDHKRR